MRNSIILPMLLAIISSGYIMGEETPAETNPIADVNISRIKNYPTHAIAAVKEIGDLGDSVFIAYLPKIISEVKVGGNAPDMIMAILFCSSRLSAILNQSDLDAISALVDKNNEDHVTYYNSMLKKQKFLASQSKSTP